MFNVQKVARALEERRSKRFNPLFSNEERFRSVAMNLDTLNTTEEIKRKLQQIGFAFENSAKNSENGINDNLENLYNLSRTLRQLAQSISELPSKIKNEEQRKEFAVTPKIVADKINQAASYVIRKAEALSRR